MTHDEALELLPVYALGALDEDVAALESHLDQCAQCRTELTAHLETTAKLGEAMEVAEPPRALREAVLAAMPERAGSVRRRIAWSSIWQRFPVLLRFPVSLALSALLLVVIGLAAWNVVQQRQIREERSELLLDRSGLALLTSTETVQIRLNPVAEPGSKAHGHWYHRTAIQTQVLVIEFMPKLAGGNRYYGWLQYQDDSWRLVGPFPVDDKGHGRLILSGDDGSGVKCVAVTRQARPTTRPEAEPILRGVAP